MERSKNNKINIKSPFYYLLFGSIFFLLSWGYLFLILNIKESVGLETFVVFLVLHCLSAYFFTRWFNTLKDKEQPSSEKTHEKIVNLEEKIFYLSTGAIALSITFRVTWPQNLQNQYLLSWVWLFYIMCIFAHIGAQICTRLRRLKSLEGVPKIKSLLESRIILYLPSALLVLSFIQATILFIIFGVLNNPIISQSR